MGCLPSFIARRSKIESSPPSPSLSRCCVSPPIGGPIMVPSPSLTPPPNPPIAYTKLTRNTLLHALDLTSIYLDHHHNHPITIIALGASLHVLHLRTRLTTPALQFFHPDPSSPDNAALAAAASFAIPASHISSSPTVKDAQGGDVVQLQPGPDWLTNTVLLSLPLALQVQLAKEAQRQNDVVYASPSGCLRVLAPPWEYVVVTAIARLGLRCQCGDEEKGEDMHGQRRGQNQGDLGDAIAALRRCVVLRGGRPVKGIDVLGWAEGLYGVLVREEWVREVGGGYERAFWEKGVIW
ncbi:hypothetical protein HDK77DRAFT_514305 [Phyllosticta capitalensis]|uniref:Uncharacterized protein n=1 Tax=Phyllosticta capitalensis TaxID=121624 RepID=A0ABR1YI66_9PEZI